MVRSASSILFVRNTLTDEVWHKQEYVLLLVHPLVELHYDFADPSSSGRMSIRLLFLRHVGAPLLF